MILDLPGPIADGSRPPCLRDAMGRYHSRLTARKWMTMRASDEIRKRVGQSGPPPRVAIGFDERGYLSRYPDVACAVASGQFESGSQHFETHGRHEGRTPANGRPQRLHRAKTEKRERFRRLLRTDLPMRETSGYCDFLSDELRAAFNIVDTDAVSSCDYDRHVLDLIHRHRDGLVLDCGAGKRSVYYANVVNFEIVAYDSTDVRGVGEVLPFVDGSFDAVISIAVLEHVKDPFACAAEIARVLKPGGELICCVPSLQPYHGYPHHYYNMTHQGLRNLFERAVDVERIEVYDSVLPIWSLHWIVQSWAAGLQGDTREAFLDMRVRDLLAPPAQFLDAPFVRELSREKNLELASASVLFGRKKS
jgi:SAM-dependent methyltransferase